MAAVLRLTPRLAAAAEMVPQGAKLADVGTDHGFLPVSLLLSGRIASAVAADIRPGPLAAARRTAAEYGLDGGALRFVLCDGLDGVPEEAADTVAIAGMGGETIAGILTRAPWTAKDGRLLLLQPMSRSEELRRALPGLGLAVETERLVRDGGRLYQLLAVRGGTELPVSEAELYTGRWELIGGEPLFPEYLEGLIARMERALCGLRGAVSPEERERAERFGTALDGFYAMKKRLEEKGDDRGAEGM